jgi:hypothetical protein
MKIKIGNMLVLSHYQRSNKDSSFIVIEKKILANCYFVLGFFSFIASATDGSAQPLVLS